jgi:hypothetical protein
MNGIRAGSMRGFDDSFNSQVRLIARRRTDAHGLVSRSRVSRLRVRVRVHGHSGYAHCPARSRDAQDDLAAIADQDFAKLFHRFKSVVEQ